MYLDDLSIANTKLHVDIRRSTNIIVDVRRNAHIYDHILNILSSHAYHNLINGIYASSRQPPSVNIPTGKTGSLIIGTPLFDMGISSLM